MYNALSDLIHRLQDPRILRYDQNGTPVTIGTLAQNNIFNQLGTDASGNKLTTASFVQYLVSAKPGFFNGVTSTYCEDVLVQPGYTCYKNAILKFILNGFSVKQYFQQHSDEAITGTPSFPLLTFVRPTSVLYSSSGENRGNETLIFHEALHGKTGQFDRFTPTTGNGILEKLGYSTNDPSCKINVVIWDTVLSQSPGLDSTTSSCP